MFCLKQMTHLLITVALCVATIPLASAQSVLTLPQALALAEASSPRLASARARLEGAQLGIATASQFPNPELESLTGGVRARVPGIATGRGTSISLAQTVELPAVRASRIRAAEAGRDGSSFGLAEARLDLFAGVRLAYFEVLQRKAEVQLAIDTEGLLEQIRNRIEVRVKVGEAPKFELTRADAELARARTASNAARLRVAQALAQLRTTVGAPLPELTDVADVKPEDGALPELALLRAELEARHPALLQARANIARAESRLDNERALRTPQPTLIAGIDRQPETNQWLFGVALPLPLFNQRQGQIGEARAAIDEARAALEARRIELQGALDVAVRRAEIARQQVAAFDGGLVNQAETALSVADAAYRFGERGFIEVLDAQRVLRQVRSDALAARYELQAALIEIERLRAADLKQGMP